VLVTRWKIFKGKYITKFSTFLLLIVFLMIGVSSALNIYLKVKNYESIAVKNYLESDSVSNDLKQAVNRLEYVMRVYKNEDYILRGGTVENIGIKDNQKLAELYNDYLAENNYEDNQEIRELFFLEMEHEIQVIKESIIASDLASYEKIISELNLPQGYIYYATDGENETTNTGNPNKDYYLLHNAYILLTEKGIELKPDNGSDVSDPLNDIFESETKYTSIIMGVIPNIVEMDELKSQLLQTNDRCLVNLIDIEGHAVGAGVEVHFMQVLEIINIGQNPPACRVIF
jgi:hypothetical protein